MCGIWAICHQSSPFLTQCQCFCQGQFLISRKRGRWAVSICRVWSLGQLEICNVSRHFMMSNCSREVRLKPLAVQWHESKCGVHQALLKGLYVFTGTIDSEFGISARLLHQIHDSLESQASTCLDGFSIVSLYINSTFCYSLLCTTPCHPVFYETQDPIFCLHETFTQLRSNSDSISMNLGTHGHNTNQEHPQTCCPFLWQYS